MTEWRKACPGCRKVYTHPPALAAHMKACVASKILAETGGNEGEEEDEEADWSKMCPNCKRIFTHPPAFAVHRKSCTPGSPKLAKEKSRTDRTRSLSREILALTPTPRSETKVAAKPNPSLQRASRREAQARAQAEAPEPGHEQGQEQEQPTLVFEGDNDTAFDADAEMARLLQRELNGFRGTSPRRTTYNPADEAAKSQWKPQQNKKGLWNAPARKSAPKPKAVHDDQADDDEKVEEEEDEPAVIRVGAEYQATAIPVLAQSVASPAVPPAAELLSKRVGTVVWAPEQLAVACRGQPLQNYVNGYEGARETAYVPGLERNGGAIDKCRTAEARVAMAKAMKPPFCSERALANLHRHSYDLTAAAASLEAWANPRKVATMRPPAVGGLLPGSQAEARFEEAMDRHGKNFRRICRGLNEEASTSTQAPSGGGARRRGSNAVSDVLESIVALVEKGEQSMPGVSKKVTVPGLTLFYYSEWKHTAAHKAWKARWADRSRDECQACHKGGRLISCDKCPASWHPRCHGFASWDAALEELGPKGAWTCQLCTEEGAGPNPPFTPTDEPGGATAASGGGKSDPRPKKPARPNPLRRSPRPQQEEVASRRSAGKIHRKLWASECAPTMGV